MAAIRSAVAAERPLAIAANRWARRFIPGPNHSTVTALFRSLLRQLMTAQLRVHDLDLPELEAASSNMEPNCGFPNREIAGKIRAQF